MRRLALALLAWMACPAAWAASPALVVPQGGSAAWLLPPGRAKGLALGAQASFALSPKGPLWLAASPSLLAQVDPLALVRLKRDVSDMAFLPDGKLLLLSGDLVAGLGVRSLKAKGPYQGILRPLMRLPGPGFQLGTSFDEGCLAYGPDPGGGQVVYRVGDKGRAEKLLTWKSPILAAVEAHGYLYLGLRNSVVRLGLKTGDRERLLQVPQGVYDLAWVEGAGLVVSTRDGLYRLPAPYQPLRFMDCRECAVRGGRDLYVLTRDPAGILKISGLAALRFRPDTPTPAPTSTPTETPSATATSTQTPPPTSVPTREPVRTPVQAGPSPAPSPEASNAAARPPSRPQPSEDAKLKALEEENRRLKERLGLKERSGDRPWFGLQVSASILPVLKGLRDYQQAVESLGYNVQMDDPMGLGLALALGPWRLGFDYFGTSGSFDPNNSGNPMGPGGPQGNSSNDLHFDAFDFSVGYDWEFLPAHRGLGPFALYLPLRLEGVQVKYSGGVFADYSNFSPQAAAGLGLRCYLGGHFALDASGLYHFAFDRNQEGVQPYDTNIYSNATLDGDFEALQLRAGILWLMF